MTAKTDGAATAGDEPLNSHAAAVSLRGLGVVVDGKELLRDVSIEIPANQITLLVGPSGAGKSVLLRLLGGLVDPHDPVIRQTGQIVMHGDRGAATDEETSPQDHGATRRVGIVFQNFALFDQWSPLDNVRFAIDHRADPSSPPEQSAEGWLEELGVPVDTPVAVLSGGQKQRLAIARTLAADPAVILYDEPTSGLDAATGGRVAELIRRTQRNHQRTAIVVTHDYSTLLPIADRLLVLDPQAKTLRQVDPKDWPQVADSIRPLAQPAGKSTDGKVDDLGSASRDRRPGQRGWLEAIDRLLTRLGRGALGLLSPDGMPRQAIRLHWVGKFFWHYLHTVGGPSAIFYLAAAGALVGFTATYFSIQFLPYRLYTKPLLLEDLLAAIGFALYRILTPVLATILVAARCGAAVAADVGVKRYGAQLEAMRTLGISPPVYVMLPILAAFVLGTPLLTAVAFQVARFVSLLAFTGLHPELGPYFWHPHFHEAIGRQGAGIADGWWVTGWLDPGWRWVLLKTVLCGIGVGAISYRLGSRPQRSATDVSHAITATVLWSTLWVLVVHFAISLVEFRTP